MRWIDIKPLMFYEKILSPYFFFDSSCWLIRSDKSRAGSPQLGEEEIQVDGRGEA